MEHDGLMFNFKPPGRNGLPWSLEARNIGVQVETVQALDLKGYMLAEKLVDVGHGGPPCGGILPCPTITNKALFEYEYPGPGRFEAELR